MVIHTDPCCEHWSHCRHSSSQALPGKNDKLHMGESAARSHDPTMPMSEIERENDVDMRSSRRPHDKQQAVGIFIRHVVHGLQAGSGTIE